jgi:uncharacterized protein
MVPFVSSLARKSSNKILFGRKLKAKYLVYTFGTIICVLFCGLFLSVSNVIAQSNIKFPQYTGYVNDYEGIIENDAELEAKLQKFEKESTVEIVVATVSDFQGTTIDDYAVKLFQKWEIGKEGKDNGILVLISKQQKGSRIEVGYGLEGTLPDALTGRIQDGRMIPDFKNDKYSEGISKGVETIIAIIKDDQSAYTDTNRTIENQDEDSNVNILEGLLIAAFFFFYIMAATKSWWLGGVVSFVIGIIVGVIWFPSWGWYILPVPFALVGFMIDFVLSRTFIGEILVSILHLVGFNSRGNGGSGGGISFGGGSSGGGGSSRGW